MQTPDTPPAPADDCVIPILGMHRSGTSMFTRALQLMGVELGEPLMAPQADNPKGFWENEFFYGVNVRILQAIQRHFSGYGRRDDLLQIPGISAMIERTDEDLSTIEDYIRSQFGASRVWGWKDPRTVLLFPFWLPVLVELGFRRIRPMIITRHPSSCVRSLAARTDLDPLAGALGIDKTTLALEMWIAYAHVLLDIAAETGAYVSVHEWFMDADLARAELGRAAVACGGLDLNEGLDQALGWLDPGAVHHLEPPTLTGERGEEALDLYGDLVMRARQQQSAYRERDTPLQELAGPELSRAELVFPTSRPAATAS